ncbi:hypothetical protein GUITHDRAFT_153294 [Guillardia theta CCMP2712]|uniref:Uncharacterized protein n=1 Tax=Guillardia theta (strain CCMP2712) TaxID=905079 RepID=L1J3Y3_GUITC|nr:hypothetical protein GUITHDRAFT_153294 [Guillardia theta CCMP2712]EKX43238.1 hypothetical protein GUITHDRAFT_153294 [Guillardia theta CCMP2712]|eukprot:XP_005830218.1 hypothetical protein GUITHDRAFT_153294 [Guillardia theta CCMP2712]
MPGTDDGRKPVQPRTSGGLLQVSRRSRRRFKAYDSLQSPSLPYCQGRTGPGKSDLTAESGTAQRLPRAAPYIAARGGIIIESPGSLRRLCDPSLISGFLPGSA